MQNESLFERLGGKSGISKIVDDIVEMHSQNPAIKARFLPILEDPDRLNVIKKHTCEFLGAGSGGSNQYSGRSMHDTHRGMNINEAEYMATIDDILGALRKNKIDEQAQKDVLAIAYSLKEEILHV